MTIKHMKQRVSKGMVFKIMISILLILLLTFYFKVFYTKGVYFDDVFLNKKETSYGRLYSNQRNGIQITVNNLSNEDGRKEIIYQLPHDINRRFVAELEEEDLMGSIDIKIKDQSEKLIFEGTYNHKSPFLYDENDLFFDDYFSTQVNGKVNYNEQYKVPLKNVADFAIEGNDRIRGNYAFLVFAVILFIVTAIDVKYPLFFFTLKHFLSVENPEPSDLYLSIQKVCWGIYPFLGIILMILAINTSS